MPEKNIQEILQSIVNQKSKIFKNKKILSLDYIPEQILHRQKQIEEITKILSPIFREEPTSNIFIYGKPGTGKTTTINYIIKEIKYFLDKQENKNLQQKIKIIYLNCKEGHVSDTEYRLISTTCSYFGKQIPAGLSIKNIYDEFFRVVDYQKANIILVLDEIDNIVSKNSDDFLYNLARKRFKNINLTLIGISNNINFIELLDPRIKSALNQEEFIFPPYNAEELLDILKQRSDNAFEKSVVSEGVLEKVAGIIAQQNGDMRRAINLLRVVGELAERNNLNKLSLELVEEAEKKLEENIMLEMIYSQPLHSKIILYSVLQNTIKTKTTTTGKVYEQYEQLCKTTKQKSLTSRRVTDFVVELDMLGLISTNIASYGRYGRTRELSINYPKQIRDQITTYLRGVIFR